jgi:glutathione synthase/RimK-type ligase-like ATP-grasp enzyme
MDMRFKIFPYKMGSLAAKKLAASLGVKRVFPTYDARRQDVIINWGNSRAPGFIQAEHDLNKNESIALASNKLKTFQALRANEFEHIPEWTIQHSKAIEWADEGHKVYCRQSLTGHSGYGIVLASDVDHLVTSPLYTKATKHKHEYRVHVFNGEAIDVQQKKKRLGVAGGSGIRNHSNGWVFARVDIQPPAKLVEAAIKAVELLGLNFGAVDVGYRERDDKVFVFEVNTAPGIEGTTLDKYAAAFKSYLRTVA